MKTIDNLTYVFSKDNVPVHKAIPGEILCFNTKDCFAKQVTEEAHTVDKLDLNKANPTAGPV